MKKRFTEKQIYWLPSRSRGWTADQGAVSSARLFRGQLLPRSKFGGMSVSDAKRLKELESENARLKKMLAESMLEIEVTREALRKSGERTLPSRAGAPHDGTRLE